MTGVARRHSKPFARRSRLMPDNGSSGLRRPKVVMICAHEPGLDPRIGWEAEAAADRFDVTVLGFNRDDGSLPDAQGIDGYQVVRLPRRLVSGTSYFWRLKDVIPRPL